MSTKVAPAAARLIGQHGVEPPLHGAQPGDVADGDGHQRPAAGPGGGEDDGVADDQDAGGRSPFPDGGEDGGHLRGGGGDPVAELVAVAGVVLAGTAR